MKRNQKKNQTKDLHGFMNEQIEEKQVPFASQQY